VALTIDLREASGSSAGSGKTLVFLSGVVDENADMGALAGLTGRVDVNLKGVRRLNSIGVRHWIDALRALCLRAQVVYVECSVAVIGQLNMISGFLGQGRVASFYAAMRCERCDVDVDQLFERAECDDALPPVACARCGATLELDDDEDQYLLFLREPTRVSP
jgi:hypothetical protein